MCESVVGELHAAAFLGDGLRVDQILAGHLHLLEATNEWGWTPLMQAAKGGHLGLVATLVSHGADVNAVNKLGMDVLSLASASGHRRIVLLLMEHGAKSGTAAISAAVHGHSEIFSQVSEVLEDQVLKISNSTILHLAVAVGAADIVHESVRRGANPNSRDEAGMTALDLAEQDADSASKREILTILRKVSDCTLSGEWSEGVVESSRVGDLGRLLVLLAEMSTKCMMRQDLHHTHDFSKALLAAAENGHALIIDILLKQKVNLNVFGTSGMTPLMLAASRGHVEATERLLGAGADCKAKSSVTGHTAFELASLSDETPPELTRILAKHTIQNAEAATTPRTQRRLLKWPLSPQPFKRNLLVPKSPHRPSSLPGSPTYQRSLSEPVE
ncbi:ankyrin repeat and SAM domain-containing protein 6-like isoform X4 [Neocloeon triangulifer]|nr:ankyrin repeat and SAM domain-containing protein 6-like isoform X4 [Neocloeon triangulifer]